MKYYFIVNPGSRTGKGKSLWDELESKLEGSKADYEVFFTKKDENAAEIAEQICKDHPEIKRIIIVGGDGTINEVINGLSDYGRIILGIIPTGSGNDLARGLGIPDESEKAFQHVIHPREFKKVDHGLLEYLDDDTPARKFAVSAGIGYDADICYHAQKSPLKKILNKFGMGASIYYLMGIKLIFANKRAGLTLTIDGKRKIVCEKAVFVAAMNTLYEGGGIPMAPGADPTDGRLTLCIVNNISRLQHCMLMTSAKKGEHIKSKGVEVISCKSVEIEADRPLVLHTDGEYAGKHKHVRLSCLPEQIRMIL
ncbi:MAG: diacylglycerol kinase family lipid kinase [Lachnospiraceae bacterium]|nr:diacylglycerol kinase family lipid kinase [Lachnospiraceae bacterium]